MESISFSLYVYILFYAGEVVAELFGPVVLDQSSPYFLGATVGEFLDNISCIPPIPLNCTVLDLEGICFQAPIIRQSSAPLERRFFGVHATFRTLEGRQLSI